MVLAGWWLFDVGTLLIIISISFRVERYICDNDASFLVLFFLLELLFPLYSSTLFKDNGRVVVVLYSSYSQRDNLTIL